jgi:hypothetical protein
VNGRSLLTHMGTYQARVAAAASTAGRWRRGHCPPGWSSTPRETASRCALHDGQQVHRASGCRECRRTCCEEADSCLGDVSRQLPPAWNDRRRDRRRPMDRRRLGGQRAAGRQVRTPRRWEDDQRGRDAEAQEDPDRRPTPRGRHTSSGARNGARRLVCTVPAASRMHRSYPVCVEVPSNQIARMIAAFPPVVCEHREDWVGLYPAPSGRVTAAYPL